MGDVQVVTPTRTSKSSQAADRKPLGTEPPVFTLPPHNVYVSLGGTAHLSGKVRGYPDPQICWYRNGKVVVLGGRFTVEQGSCGTFSLTVQGVQGEDGGFYTCEAINDAGSQQVTMEIIVKGNTTNKRQLPSSSGLSGGHVWPPAVENRTSIWGESPPRFVTKPSRLFVRMGQSGKFCVKITGRPQPQVKWLKGDVEVQSSERFNVFERSGIHFLEIRDVCAADAGIYTCSVSNSAGKAVGTAELNVHITQTSNGNLNNKRVTKSPAQAETIMSPRTTKETKDSTRIKAEGYQSSAMSAKVTGEPRHEESQKTSPHTHPKVEGFLQTNPVTQPKPEKSQQTSPLSYSREDIWRSKPGEVWRSKPGEVRRGFSPSRHSHRGQTTLPTETKAHSLSEGKRIQLDTGWSPAHPVNEPSREACRLGRESRTEALGTPPTFDLWPENQEVMEGSKIIFKCQVMGSPGPTVTWVKDGAVIQEGLGVSTQREGALFSLCLENVQRTDAGQYSCTATNSKGKITKTWSLSTKRFSLTEQISYPAFKPPSVENSVTSKKMRSSPVDDPKRLSAPAFLRGLRDLRVMDGGQVSMTVEVTGHPRPGVIWLHNGQEIQEMEDFHFEQKENKYSLLIQEVFPEDTGTYTCEIWNEVGVARSEALLTVQEPQDGVQPWFITKPKSTTARPGQHILLSCAIAGDPFPEFLWMKDGHLVSGRDFEILQREDLVSLLIRSVKVHHAGHYEIRLRNKVGECSSMANLHVNEETAVNAQDSRNIEGSQCAEGVDQTARGREVEREGPGIGHCSCTVQQEREEEQEEASTTRGLLKRRVETKEHCEDQIRQQEPQQLDFRSVLGRKVTTKSVSEEDLKEVTTEQMDFRANLQRQIKPKTQSEDERKIHSPQQVDFRAVLEKKGGPAPKLRMDKTEPPPDFRSVLSSRKKQLNLEKNGESPQPKHSQETENNPNNMDEEIKEKKCSSGGKEPVFTQALSDVTVREGAQLHLQCQLLSDAHANVTWTLNGKVIKSSKFIVIANKGGVCSLSIDKVLPEDEGQYVCRAENSSGRTECSCSVQVKDSTDTNSSPPNRKTKKPSIPTTENEARIKKPTPKTPFKQGTPPQILQFPDDMKILAGKRVDLLCQFTGSLPISCTWLKFRKPIQEGKSDISIETTDTSSKLTIANSQQEHCGCYTIEIRNSYGARQAALNLTIVDKPDPPARVPAASDIRKSSLTLSWYGPTYDGGSAVTSYNLEIWNSVDKVWKELVSCNSTSYNVQNLLQDREYKFRVRAVNMYGIGEPSVESESVTVGVEEENENEEDEAEPSDDESEKEPEYRQVAIRTDVKVKDLYDVEERLGSGKFGTVCKLVEKATKKVWAGKFIKAYSDKEKENVRQEISIMNCLHHPKLVQCVDAFEGKSDIVMVLEMISGGELFERIIDEDFELTEREVIKYMLQIIDGVRFIHQQGIVHLDLKPENIMCVNKTGSRIKLIDFGLARRLENSGSLKVLFGTPEFVAPEVINYEAIGYPTDMWSIGVICYILVSGLSPFMGDNDSETLSNVTSATWDFEDEAFDEISDEAKDFISSLLKKDMKVRLTCDQCLQHPWLKQDTRNMEAKKLSKERMKRYILRRKWQKTGHAVRAIGRLSSMAMLAGVHAKKGSPAQGTITTDIQSVTGLICEEKTPVKPTFSKIIKDVEVVEGSAACFDCKIEGFPDPEVVWYKDDQPIKETRHFQIDYDEDGNCSLVISEVCGEDDAKYTCKAVNSIGEATCSAELIVEVMGGKEEHEEEE
ncbi:myosin light chain kinase, smooth muscle [Chanos chanos]|uniref:Myosin light chain kinase, smooth muscle n=1 Tax=Chanos chanos TaxID=29144 RepID=A0A6J2WG72_CHACN|nr:myosin light chain kinase, smooth muscle-like [Chanos chanos]